MSTGLEIQIIAIFLSVSCALPGCFLVLRQMSMLTDSITHTVLLGIVLGYLITHDLSSPWLVMGASIMGLFTVWLTELISKVKYLANDSAMGIVFPLLFSIAMILISSFGSNVHLDTDMVLLGELAFLPFKRFMIGNVDMGATAIYTSGFLLICNLFFIRVFYKELKLISFDPIFAQTMGLSIVFIHYALMAMVSFTAVEAFEGVGSVLVIAFMIIPGNTAYLLVKDLKYMLIFSAIFAVISSVLGYHVARIYDISIAGSMAVMSGLIFAFVFIYKKQYYSLN